MTRIVVAAISAVWASVFADAETFASTASTPEVDAEPPIADDDECNARSDQDCALNALQRRAENKADLSTAVRLEENRSDEAEHSAGIWHYALPCWNYCPQGPGFCESYCGPGNACCRYMRGSDPAECHNVRFWPVLTFYTCVKTGIVPDGNKVVGGPDAKVGSSELIYSDVAALLEPSTAEAKTFYMYRVQGEQNYDPENQDMGNLAGVLWYLHNEIVWHHGLSRSGTYFSTKKTRIERFKVTTKATQPLFGLGMNFGPVNAFDSTKCTGPYKCTNFKEFGYTVGCEDWSGGAASFPHDQWVGKNKYPGAAWFSLPGPCSSMGLGAKTKACVLAEPGGACRSADQPTGTGNCTYVYEKMGEISINELEGISNSVLAKSMGYYEYDKKLDEGYGIDFWNNKGSSEANQKRIDSAKAFFAKKYPDQQDLEDPTCDFDKDKFYKSRQ